MIDPFFGGPAVGMSPWTGMPNVGVGWAQPPVAPPNRQAVAGEGFRLSPPMMMTPLAAPVFMSPELPIEVAAPPVMMAVAQRRGLPQGPTTDREVEEYLYDVLDLLPGLNEVEVRCENGRVTLTGTVQHKKQKRDVGEICWALPAVNDVQNNVTIAPRRRTRGAAAAEQGSSPR